jgi:hypothetical protein
MQLFGQEVATALAPELAIIQTLPRKHREWFNFLEPRDDANHFQEASREYGRMLYGSTVVTERG